jgi:membrane protein
VRATAAGRQLRELSESHQVERSTWCEWTTTQLQSPLHPLSERSPIGCRRRRRLGISRDVTAIEHGVAADKQTAPDPDDPRKPDSPTDLEPPSWRYTARMAYAEFKRDQCTDLAAALTYYAIGAAVPAMVVLLALVGVTGNPTDTTNAIVDLIGDLGQGDVAEDLRGPLTNIAESRAAGPALVLGALLALWSASAYVGAFGRAMNRIYEIDEGRPFLKLRAVNLLVTMAGLVGSAVLLITVAGTDAVARELGQRIGLGETFVTAWGIARWPLMLVVMALLVSLLYYATPNVQQPKFRWISVGAALAMLIWIIGSIAFSVYVNQFGNYEKTYGSLAGVFIVLLWLFLTNLALLFGAEFDSEMERARELEGGIAAEEDLQLPPRDTEVSVKQEAKLHDDIERGRQLRHRAQRARSPRHRDQ